jgi:Lambda phage tail tube protein, TTP
MASSAKTAQGVKLKRGGTAIAEVKDIGGPDESVDRIEVTSLDSTSKEFIAGLRDGGDVKCEALSIGNNATQQALYADFQAGTKSPYTIECPDGEAYAFQAIVLNFGRKFGTNAARTLSFTLKISGDVTPTFPV